MALLDSIMRSVVPDVLNLLSGTGVIRRITTVYDPTTGDETPTTVNHPVAMSPPLNYRENEIDGTTVVVGDAKFVVEAMALSIEISPETDKVVHGDRVWDIVRAKPVYSGDQIAAFVVQVR